MTKLDDNDLEVSKINSMEAKCVGDKNLAPNELETKCVGDKSKENGDKKKEANQESARPVLVPDKNQSAVSKMINFNINLKVKNLTKKEVKLIQFCERRITINNRRLQVQRDFRFTGMIDQRGTFRLHGSSDPDFWVTIDLVGFTEIVIPRCGLELLGHINFCPYITWTVVGVDGHRQADLTIIGQILNQHVMFDNRVSIKPFQFTPISTTVQWPVPNVKVDENKATKPISSAKLDKKAPILKEVKKAVPVTPRAPSVVNPPPPTNTSTGFPIRPPVWAVAPEFAWRAQDRNLGTPVIRRRQHASEKMNLPNLTMFNGSARLVHNGNTTDPANERREMLFITT